MRVDAQKRIAVAFLVGATIVAGAFIIRSYKEVQSASGTLTTGKSAERTYIQTQDSNNDGVPDWQDELIQGEPLILPTGSSTYKEPTTVTGKFAIRFFEDYILSKTNGAFGDTKEELIAKATQRLAEQAIDEIFSEKDITIFPDSDSKTLHDYGNRVASVILAHPNKGDSESIILQDYVRYQKPERLLELDPIALAYTTVVKDFLATPVPKTYIKEHLDLTNAVNAVREDVKAMQKVEEDPMYTLIRLKRYQDDVQGLSNALSNVFNTLYLRDTVRWDEGEAVTNLIEFPTQ
jgi:hypothetical protein